MIKHTAPQSDIASFGSWIATAGYDNRVILWDKASHLSTAVGFHDHLVNQVAFSPCGRYLASSSSDYSVRVWEIPTMRLVQVLQGHRDDVEGLAFHANKPWIATTSRDSGVRVFGLDGQLVCHFEGHAADVLSVQWLHGTDQLVSSGDDGTIRVWDVESGDQRRLLDLKGCETDTIALSNSGLIFAANDDGEVILISQDKTASMKVHRAGIKRLKYDSDARRLVSLSYDRSVKVWSCDEDSMQLSCLASSQLPHCIWPRSCALVDESTLAFCTFGSSFALYDLKTQGWQLERVEDTSSINGICVDQAEVFSVGDSGKVCLQEQRDEATEYGRVPSLCNFVIRADQQTLVGGQMGELFEVETGEVKYRHHSPLNGITSFMRHGQTHFALATYTGELVILRQHRGNLTAVTQLKVDENAIKAVASDEKQLFSVSASSRAIWVDIESLSVSKKVEGAHTKIANDAVCLGYGNFASVGRDLSLVIWSAAGTPIPHKTPHTHSIKCVAASPDGRYVATGAYNGAVHIFDRMTETWLPAYRPTHAGISCLSYDSRAAHSVSFLASSYDGQVYTLLVDCQENDYEKLRSA